MCLERFKCNFFVHLFILTNTKLIFFHNNFQPYFKKDVATGSTIIYCLTRKDTDELSLTLISHGIVCESYHAGKSLAERKRILIDFQRDALKIVVATIAFGLGIDKRDVRQGNNLLIINLKKDEKY